MTIPVVKLFRPAGLLYLACILSVISFGHSASGNSSLAPVNPANASGNLVHPAADKLPFFTANYNATLKGFELAAIREYRAVSTTGAELSFTTQSWLASLNEYSRFSWEGEQMEPVHFVSQRRLLGKEKKYSLSFYKDNKKIISTWKNEETVIINPGQALDTLGFQLQLQYDLLQQKKVATYHIVNKNKIRHYGFEIIGREVIDTDIGPLQTIKVKVIRENPDRVTWLWMAVDWHNLLTRMEQYEEGKKEFELRLTSAIVDGKTVTGLQQPAGWNKKPIPTTVPTELQP